MVTGASQAGVSRPTIQPAGSSRIGVAPSCSGTGGGSSQSSAHSSEQERREREPRKPWSKAAKLPSLTLDDTVTLTIPAAQLPPDTKLKGYEETTVRDLLIRRVVLRFRRARYPSALTGKS